MTYRESIIGPTYQTDGVRYDNPRAVISPDLHQDVLHRVERLKVKNGRLQVLSGFAPAKITAK